MAQVLSEWEDWSVARAAKETTRPAVAHPAGQVLVPTFTVRKEDAGESGAGDWVTVADDQELEPRREERRIAHTAWSTFQRSETSREQGKVGDQCDGWLIAFDSLVSREFRGEFNARLARWPVGNVHTVPTLTFGTPGIGGEGPGVEGNIDDLISLQLSEDIYFFPIAPEHEQGLSKREKDVDLGIYLVDHEVIAVTKREEKFARHDLVTLVRGALGSTAEVHSREAPAWLLDWPLVHVVEALPKRKEDSIALRPVRRGVAPTTDLRDGYVAVDRGRGAPYAEVRPYVGLLDGQALEPPRDRLGRAAFRSAFGSGRVDLKIGELLVELPFRYHDRYGKGVSSLQGLFFMTGRELPGSFVQRVDWSEHLPNPFCQVKVAVRADGVPGWDADPADAPGQAGRLYLFDDPKQPNAVSLQARRVEMRLYLTYQQRAFYRDGWKQAAVVGDLRLHYRQPTLSLRREERVE